MTCQASGSSTGSSTGAGRPGRDRNLAGLADRHHHGSLVGPSRGEVVLGRHHPGQVGQFSTAGRLWVAASPEGPGPLQGVARDQRGPGQVIQQEVEQCPGSLLLGEELVDLRPEARPHEGTEQLLQPLSMRSGDDLDQLSAGPVDTGPKLHLGEDQAREVRSGSEITRAGHDDRVPGQPVGPGRIDAGGPTDRTGASADRGSHWIVRTRGLGEEDHYGRSRNDVVDGTDSIPEPYPRLG